MRPLDIGIAYELRADFSPAPGAPTDALEEYDSPETVAALRSEISNLGHRPRELGGGRELLRTLIDEPPELVFNNSEGRQYRSREAHVPAVCEMLGIPCTHSDPLTMALTLDKALTKRVVHSAGLRTPPFEVAANAVEVERINLPFPLFVKPLAEGSSMGVRVTSRVNDRAELAREAQRCFTDYRQPVLVEALLPGAEITVAITGSGESARVFGSMEIAPAHGSAEAFVYGLESKRGYRELVRYHAPPRGIGRAQCADAEQLALAAYRLLGCRDIARVDLRFDATGHASFMEINPLPGLNPVTGDIVVMAGLLGRDYREVIQTIINEAVRRYPALQ
jgi:D-alanine-D-alanine ligase